MLMYALYNNLTFNNLKAFDPNVFQVLRMIVRACKAALTPPPPPPPFSRFPLLSSC
jgi:hypothetical protein